MIVLDTNVLSETMSASPSPAVLQWLTQQPGDELFTTSITLAEVLQGIELLPRGKRRTGLLAAAQSVFSDLFPGRILSFEESAARAFAPIAVNRRQSGRPISLFDAQIAAITRANGATLATRDVSDFVECGILVVNPWE